MSRNTIFLAVVGGAILIAVLMGTGSSDGDNEMRISVSTGGANEEIHFNGETYRCDEETNSVVLTHDDGSTTTVYCE